MAEKIEAQKEEIRTLEAKMQAQLQAQAKRFMGVMRMPLSAFDGSSSQGVLKIGFWWRHFGEGCLVEAVWWRLFGGGRLVEAVWWRLFGGGCLVDAVWWRLFGGGCLVDAVWWRLFGGCCLVEALVDFGAALLGI
ncbi:hypothetical protein H6P81_017978 [Aristolochia fimbriata]|uniref:Uncharacterized protein n=1 Tax=Aristolochia fimbriata TaxID=158543 RepID=A0AAV7E101_ARIFI|nr:hypothetical protein H6P81_017978 [Aristolochia fimbriata]